MCDWRFAAYYIITNIVVCVITIYPYYVMFVTAFRSNTETTDMYFQHIFPTKWIWSNLKDIIDRNVLVYLKNSLIIAGGATAANRPITVGITTFSSFNMIERPYLFASSLLATIPVVILFICIEKHLVSGLTSGGVKS